VVGATSSESFIVLESVRLLQEISSLLATTTTTTIAVPVAAAAANTTIGLITTKIMFAAPRTGRDVDNRKMSENYSVIVYGYDCSRDSCQTKS